MPPTAKRPAVTVAVLASSSKRRQRDLLERLTEELEPHDNVVLLGARHDPASPASWHECRTRGALARPSAPVKARDLVLVVEEAVLPSTGFLDELVAAVGDPNVDAVAPRSNIADGDDLVLGAPYRPGDAGGRKAALASWLDTHPSTFAPARHLGGPCVLLRRALVDRLGGLDALRRACLAPELDANDHRRALVVAEGAYVHHLAPRPSRGEGSTWPVVSACLITKDEEQNLPACLASLTGVVDEIVVYDTGSSDGTVALARALGAHVIAGEWDGDFARARNAALEHCRGQWIVWVDADETLVCDDATTLRARLEMAPIDVDGFLVLIDNLQGTEASTSLTHPAVRVFRRSACRWEGRLHEQVHRRFNGDGPDVRPLEVGRILHRGYLQKALDERAKGERNLRSAFADLAGGSELSLEVRLLSLGRSYLLAGAPEEGVDLCTRALEVARDLPTKRMALRALSDGYSALGRPEKALEMAEELRAIAAVPVLADLIEGREHLNRSEPAEALACLERLDRIIVDDDGFEYHPSLVAASRAQALVALGRHDEAADVLLATLQSVGGLDVHLGQLVDAVEIAGRDLAEIYDALPAGRALAFVPQLLQMEPSVGDRVLEGWHARDEASLPILAAAGNLALRLPVERQLVWSARLRSRGLATSCPLVASATVPSRPADRVLATAVGWVSFADQRARQAFGASVLSLAAGERPAIRAQLEVLSPGLLPVFDALVPLARPSAPPPGGPRASVLLVSRVPCDLGAVALAAELASRGHAPILLQPHPAATVEDLLADLGVEVDGWLDPGDGRWTEPAAALVAQHDASGPIDAAVVLEGGEDLLETLGRLLPGTPVVLERPGAADATTLLARLGSAPAPEPSARAGLCIALDRRAPRGGEGEEVLGRLLEGLAARLPALSIALCGDDPGRRIASGHPELIPVGPTADPTPWVRSARALVVVATSDDSAWLALGEASATPTFLVQSTASLDAALEALASDTAGPPSPGSRCAAAGAPTPSVARVEALLGPVLPDPTARRRPARPGRARPRVCLRGTFEGDGATAAVNAALAHALDDPSLPFDLVVEPDQACPAGEDTHRAPRCAALGCDLELRHRETPDFAPSAADRLVVLAGLPHGGRLPLAWVGPVRDHVDELWVTTDGARRAAEDSGVDAARVLVLAGGADLSCFRPDGPRRGLRTEKATKLLFAGPATEQSGLDALLEAHFSSFSASDDVCLVLHLEAGGSARLEADVRRAAAARGPALELVESPLGPEERAALYRACDAFVHPARTDAYGLRLAEALASGIAVVATAGASFLDDGAETAVRLVAARPVPAPPVAGVPTPGATLAEPRRADLAAALHEVVADPARARRRGAAAGALARSSLSWAHVTERAVTRIAALVGSAEPDTSRGAPHLAAS